MKKVYIVLIGLVITYVLIAIIFFHKKTVDNKTKQYILFNNNVLWKYKNNQFWTVYNKLKIIDKKSFYIYENYKYKGKYNLGFNEEALYLFDKNNNSIKYEGNLLGFTDNNKHRVVNLVNEKINDYDKKTIVKYLESKKINYDKIDYDNVFKITLSLDEKNKQQVLYNINNMFDEEKKEDGYSLIFMNDSGKIYELVSDIKANSTSISNGYEYSTEYIADLDGDNKLDFIVSKVNYGSPYVCYLLIQKEKKDFKITKSC